MNIKPIDLLRLQRVELSMLEDFVRVCDRFGLMYFIVGGTLLGAVRHGGFIPWDDDIDVAMPRDDYERFMRSGQQEMKDCYFIQNYVTDPEFPGNYAKIRDNRTTFVESSLKHRRINHGVYLDIFPLDGVSDNRLKRYIDKFRIGMLQIQIGKYYYRAPGTKKHASFKGQIAMILSSIATVGLSLADIQKRIHAIATSCRYIDSEYVINNSGIYGEREIMPRQYFGEGTLIKFESIHVSAPRNYDAYLKHLYTNYMQLPPEEKRTPNHELEKLDLDAPYTQ
jgi:lipopolysaccharide cholinephosphotransferase